MTMYARPICFGCRYRVRDASDLRCEAYPDGIPAAIAASDVDHRKPHTGDRGIRFAPASPADAAYAARLFEDTADD